MSVCDFCPERLPHISALIPGFLITVIEGVACITDTERITQCIPRFSSLITCDHPFH